MIDKNEFAARWHELKHKVREKWSKLTDGDLEKIHGKWDALCHEIEMKYGWKKEQAEKELMNWWNSWKKHWGDKKRKAG